jgi:ribose 5-phosphate isomerase A
MHPVILIGMTQDELKQFVAREVVNYILPNEVLGLGAGSTVEHLIREIAKQQVEIKGVVVCSESARLVAIKEGLEVFPLSQVGRLSLYIDGADEVDASLCCLKGGGCAATLEKITASVSDRFICIVDESKLSSRLGKKAPVSIEVIKQARSAVSRACVGLGGRPVYREGFISQHGNDIIDVYDLPLSQPIALEEKLNNIPGVVGHGLFAILRPHSLLLASSKGIKTINQ